MQPEYWWWDLVAKRFDLFLMMAITYTNVVEDERAKLLFYTFISGIALAFRRLPDTKSDRKSCRVPLRMC